MKTNRPSKPNRYPPLTSAEMLIWSSAYTIEYNRWTCGDTNEHPNAEVKAARVALSQAAMAVLAARAAFAANKPPLIVAASEMARQMLRTPRSKLKKPNMKVLFDSRRHP